LVVLHKGKKYIPHEYNPDELIMIGLVQGDKPEPYFYSFPSSVIDQLQPFGNLDQWIVVGIKDRMLQVVDAKKYEVHTTTETLPLKPIMELLKQRKFTKPSL
jgi:hypothetical protein